MKSDYVLRTFLAENLLTTSEVSEMLQVSRQRVVDLVKSGKLEPVKQSTQGYIFLRADVENLKMKGIDIEFRVPRFVELSGTTRVSVAFFEENISKMKEINTISIYFDPLDAAYDNFYLPNGRYYGNLQQVITPHMVLRDTEGTEMWLGGCNCGYYGEGPHGSAAILKRLGFTEQQIAPVFTYRIVKYFLEEGEIEIITSDSSFDKKSSHQNTHPIDDHALLFFMNDHLVLIQEDTYRTDTISLLRRYRKFAPNPTEVLILTDEQAKSFGYQIPPLPGTRTYGTQIYNVIIRDSSGREIWLHANISKKPLSRQEPLIRILEECGLQLPERTFLSDLSSWLNVIIHKEDIDRPLYRIVKR